MVDYVTSNDHQSYPVKGQQIVLLATYAGTAATTGTASARVGTLNAQAVITLSNVTSVGGSTITLQGSNDKTIWATLTSIASTVTTQTSYTTIYANVTPWSFYRVNTTANASTNTMSVVLHF
jgi:hypothetical protein